MDRSLGIIPHLSVSMFYPHHIMDRLAQFGSWENNLREYKIAMSLSNQLRVHWTFQAAVGSVGEGDYNKSVFVVTIKLHLLSVIV